MTDIKKRPSCENDEDLYCQGYDRGLLFGLKLARDIARAESDQRVVVDELTERIEKNE